MPNGHGTLETTYDDIGLTSTYTGTWKDGERNGQGAEIDNWTDGNVATYTGEWANDKKNGQGTRTSSGGPVLMTLIYTGPWKDGEMHGQGKRTYVMESGTDYETGEFSNGKRNGIFIEMYSDGSTKNILYKDGEKVP